MTDAMQRGHGEPEAHHKRRVSLPAVLHHWAGGELILKCRVGREGLEPS